MDASEALQSRACPWTYLPDPAPIGPESALTVGSAKRHHLGFHRTSPAARRTAQASERLRMWRNLFPVSIGGSWFRLSSLLVPPPPIHPRSTAFLSMIGQQAVPIVTDTAVALEDGEVALRLEPLLVRRTRYTNTFNSRSRGSVALFCPSRALRNILYICAHTHAQTHTNCFQLNLKRLTLKNTSL